MSVKIFIFQKDVTCSVLPGLNNIGSCYRMDISHADCRQFFDLLTSRPRITWLLVPLYGVALILTFLAARTDDLLASWSAGNFSGTANVTERLTEKVNWPLWLRLHSWFLSSCPIKNNFKKWFMRFRVKFDVKEPTRFWWKSRKISRRKISVKQYCENATDIWWDYLEIEIFPLTVQFTTQLYSQNCLEI